MRGDEMPTYRYADSDQRGINVFDEAGEQLAYIPCDEGNKDYRKLVEDRVEIEEYEETT
jgi:hypothetical protein